MFLIFSIVKKLKKLNKDKLFSNSNCHWWSPTPTEWSPTFQNIINDHPASKGQSIPIPSMVTHHPQDGPPPSPGWSPTILRMVTHHHKDGGLPSSGWSPTIPRVVTHNPNDGHPSSHGWSPNTPLTDTNYYQNNPPPSPEKSSTISRVVTHLHLVAYPQKKVECGKNWGPKCYVFSLDAQYYWYRVMRGWGSKLFSCQTQLQSM